MKKIVLMFTLVFAFSSAFVSCRDQKDTTGMDNDTEMSESAEDRGAMDDDAYDDTHGTTNESDGFVEETAEDVADAVDDAANDVGETAEEGWDEVKENTGTDNKDDQ